MGRYHSYVFQFLPFSLQHSRQISVTHTDAIRYTTGHIFTKIVMYRHPTGTFPDYRRRLGSVALTGQGLGLGLGLGLGTSLFPVGAMEIKGTVR